MYVCMYVCVCMYIKLDPFHLCMQNKMDTGFIVGLAFLGIVVSIFIVLALCGHAKRSSSRHHAAKAPSAPVQPHRLQPSQHRLHPRNQRLQPRQHRLQPRNQRLQRSQHRLHPRNHRLQPSQNRLHPRSQRLQPSIIVIVLVG